MNRLVLIAVLISTALLIGLWESYRHLLLGEDIRTYVAAAGVLLALGTFVFNAILARAQSRQQHTIKILFETRLSPEFRENLERRGHCFKEGEPVTWEAYDRNLQARTDRRLAPEDRDRRWRSAVALRSLLNYYEFLCLGIRRGDLDEAMLKGSIRAIMCNLVADCVPLIATVSSRNAKTYENLAEVYNHWRDPTMPALPRPSSPIATFGIPTIIRR